MTQLDLLRLIHRFLNPLDAVWIQYLRFFQRKLRGLVPLRDIEHPLRTCIRRTSLICANKVALSRTAILV